MTATKYRKKPVVIEAMQFPEALPEGADPSATTRQAREVYLWVEANTQGSFDPYGDELPASGCSIDPSTGRMLIATLEGVMQVKPGDYVIRGVQGEFYPCKPDIFEATYEATS